MTETITKRRCVCDICKKEEIIHPMLKLPVRWKTITVSGNTEAKCDVCDECANKILNFLKEIEAD